MSEGVKEPTNEPREAGIYWATPKNDDMRTIVSVMYDSGQGGWLVSRFGRNRYEPIAAFTQYVPCIDPLAEPRT